MNISFDTEIYEVSFLHFYELSENTGEGDEFLISCPPVASQQGVFFIFLVPFFFFFWSGIQLVILSQLLLFEQKVLQ